MLITNNILKYYIVIKVTLNFWIIYFYNFQHNSFGCIWSQVREGAKRKTEKKVYGWLCGQNAIYSYLVKQYLPVKRRNPSGKD